MVVCCQDAPNANKDSDGPTASVVWLMQLARVLLFKIAIRVTWQRSK